MRFDAPRGKLYDALKTINARWDEVDPLWNDPVRLEFEEKVWLQLTQLTQDTLRAIDRLNQVFTQCRNECEGRDFTLD